MMAMDTKDIVEKLAEIEHEQWMAWAKEVRHEVSEERRKRWQACFVPYQDLPEDVKEQDRVFARKVLKIMSGEK
jgi:hypothetical protein